MKNLFLGSAGLSALPSWLSSLPLAGRRAVLVPTASKLMPAAPFVDAADGLLRGEGMRVDRFDLEGTEASDVERALRGAGLVFVCGGYPLFLLEHVHRSGFDRIVTAAVREGRLGYAGISAGAALAAPDLDFYRNFDAEDPGTPETTRGLGLVPFMVLPHRNQGRAELHDRQVERYGAEAYLSLNDDQAVVVDGETWKVVASP